MKYRNKNSTFYFLWSQDQAAASLIFLNFSFQFLKKRMAIWVHGFNWISRNLLPEVVKIIFKNLTLLFWEAVLLQCEPTSCESITLRGNKLRAKKRATCNPTNLWVTVSLQVNDCVTTELTYVDLNKVFYRICYFFSEFNILRFYVSSYSKVVTGTVRIWRQSKNKENWHPFPYCEKTINRRLPKIQKKSKSDPTRTCVI